MTTSEKKKIGDFHTLSRYTIVEGRLVNLTPLRVGVGREPPLGAAADIAVLKIRHNNMDVPYIPGSSLKGLFRSFVEMLARSQNNNIHDPWDFETMKHEAESCNLCIVCNIFGSTELASHIKVYDALPASNTTPVTRLKTGVVIDREFQGARPGLLYTEENVEPGYEWQFRMDIINIPFPDENNEYSKYLMALVKTLKTLGLQVGARRSIGMGLMKLKDVRYTAYIIKNGSLVENGRGEI